MRIFSNAKFMIQTNNESYHHKHKLCFSAFDLSKYSDSLLIFHVFSGHEACEVEHKLIQRRRKRKKFEQKCALSLQIHM